MELSTGSWIGEPTNTQQLMIVDHVDAARERERERKPNYKMSLLDIAGDMVYLRPTVQFPKGKHLELSQDLLSTQAI